MLLLPEGQTGEVWEPAKTPRSVQIEEIWIGKYFHFFIYSNKIYCDNIYSNNIYGAFDETCSTSNYLQH